jgi:citrate lyase beta subunit
MPGVLDDGTLDALVGELAPPNRRLLADYPGETGRRQPIHVLYHGAHLFDRDTPAKLGAEARAVFEAHAPTPRALSDALGFEGAALAEEDRIHARTKAKLEREPIEDLRIDFEDGYGVRPGDEEDRHAEACGREVAAADRAGALPPFVGIRTKPMADGLERRSLRTTDRVVSMIMEANGALPRGFRITLPKVQMPEHVEVFAKALDRIEDAWRLPRSTIALEIMIEVTRAILDADGRIKLPALARAGRPRLTGVHFGTYDYTASAGVTALHQAMDHPAAELAKHLMTIAYAGTGVSLSDGSTNLLPAGDGAAVRAAWRNSARLIRRSLRMGYYQGWDLHPAQIPVRYAAAYAFYLEGLAPATARLRGYLAEVSSPNVGASVVDDVVTGQALLNFILRARESGAITEAEALATGLTAEELEGRSFSRIVEARKAALG